MTSRPRLSQLLRRTASRLADAASNETPTASELDPRLQRLAVRRGADALAAVEREIAEEIASSLGKAGQRLEDAIRDAELAAVCLRSCSEGDPDYPVRRRILREKRREAERRLRYLKIQREALGLRSHRELERRYRLPEMPPPGRVTSPSSSSSSSS